MVTQAHGSPVPLVFHRAWLSNLLSQALLTYHTTSPCELWFSGTVPLSSE